MTPCRLPLSWPCVLLMMTSACHCNDFAVSAPPAPERLATLPARLAETGLFADVEAGVLAPGLPPFRPQFELWSDDAVKRRWVALPAGGRIDTSDMDAWLFPEGTRLLLESGPGARDRADGACLWTVDPSDALLVPEGASPEGRLAPA
ncbi:hypothetical protein ACLESO_34475 [Pyxidicoccus sp. 3LG]